MKTTHHTYNDHLNKSRHPYLSFSLLFLIVSIWACDDPSPPSVPNEVDLACDLDDRTENCDVFTPSPAHSPDCIAVDDELCLISYIWEDGAPRKGALTPGESFLIRKISIFNAGQKPIRFIELTSLISTADVEAIEGELSLNEISGHAWSSSEMSLSAVELDLVNNRCQLGELLPQHGCTFSINLALHIKESAPTNVSQRIEIAADTQRGARFEWDLPLLVVEGRGGLSLGMVTLDDSTEDGQVHLGDRLRFNQVELLNHTLIPFNELDGLLAFAENQVTLIGDSTSWADSDLIGISSGTTNCPAARTVEGQLEPGRCLLSFTDILSVNPQGEESNLFTFTLFLKDSDLILNDQFDLSVELSPWRPVLQLAPIELAADENRDRLISPGERVGINQLSLENQSNSALSLRGRVLLESELISLSSSSDLSINETRLREDFYETCPPVSSCPLDVNILLEISELANLEQSIPLTVEVMDQSGTVHLLNSELDLQLPDIQLKLTHFDVQQDTLDINLSAGERGVISYVKLINEGLADATDLEVSISSSNPYITFEDESRLTFNLNTASSTLDERSGDCPSIVVEADGYCYRRTEIFFTISEDAPLGEMINFEVKATDSLGTIYLLNEQLVLF